MSRIDIPASVAESAPAARPLLEAVSRQLGSAPNVFRALGLSPAALEGFVSLSGALGGGSLDARTRARLALCVAEVNGCDYDLSAHTALGRDLARLDEAELRASRDAESSDRKAAAALRFARKIVVSRGQVSDADLAAVRAAGHGAAEIIEIIAHVALNTLTNYVNSVIRTDVDFPLVRHRRV